MILLFLGRLWAPCKGLLKRGYETDDIDLLELIHSVSKTRREHRDERARESPGFRVLKLALHSCVEVR